MRPLVSLRLATLFLAAASSLAGTGDRDAQQETDGARSQAQAERSEVDASSGRATTRPSGAASKPVAPALPPQDLGRPTTPDGPEMSARPQSGAIRPLGAEAPTANKATTELPSRYEPGQVLVLHSSLAEALAFAEAEASYGFRVRQRSNLDGLGVVLTTLSPPSGLSVPDAITALGSRTPELLAEPNHRFRLGEGSDEGPAAARAMVGWPESRACGSGRRIGLIDTLPDASVPHLADANLTTHSVLADGVVPAPKNHGTALALVLAGRGGVGLLQGAHLFAVGAFRERRDGEVDAVIDRLAAGLNWLAVNRVHVVNLSFSGPHNGVFARILDATSEQGIELVAAAGNDGADHPVTFPASHARVVAVTAIDRDRHVYRRANRGPSIEFAAPGVDLWLPFPKRSGRYYSGTSYAAPFVTAALAAGRSVTELRRSAVDLGARGRDEVFGHGLLQVAGICD